MRRGQRCTSHLPPGFLVHFKRKTFQVSHEGIYLPMPQDRIAITPARPERITANTRTFLRSAQRGSMLSRSAAPEAIFTCRGHRPGRLAAQLPKFRGQLLSGRHIERGESGGSLLTQFS